MKRSLQFTLLFALVAIATTLCSWGFLVHRTVHQLAVYELPGNMQPFYYRNMDYLVQNAPRPDTRRNTDSTEASKHFIDLEPFGDSAAWKIPSTWQQAVSRYTLDTLLTYGYVPYQVLFMKDKLTEAFRSRNADSILYYSADMGHYIGDANVPLHTSINYDGQLTNQKGLHSLWESMIPELEIETYNLSSTHKAKYLKDPAEAILNAIRRAHVLVADLLAKEKEVSRNFSDTQKFRIQMRRGRESKSFTTEFAKAYAASLQPTINQQLIHSSNLIADFWYTCWVDAGKPNLNSLLTQPFTKADKKAMKKELKLFRNNKLIENNLLISKKTSGPAE